MPHEFAPKEELLYSDGESTVIVPQKSLVEPKEGVNLTVISEKQLPPYFSPEAELSDSIHPFLVALATAKSVFGNPEERSNQAGNYHLYNQWVNVHLLPRFGGKDHFQIEIIGRNARGETWAQPVKYPKFEQFDGRPIVAKEIQNIREEIFANAEAIREEAEQTVLFDKEFPEGTTVSDKTIFKYKNFEIRMPNENPHVEEGGLHLWVHAHTDEKIEGVQDNVKNGIEQFLIAQAISKLIYSELSIPIEIHFSGNWGLPTEGHWEESLSAHANLYGAPPGTDRVDLPERPGYKRPEMPEETRRVIKAAIESNLPQLLAEFEGKHLREL